jgi:hypothetical protein
MLPRLASLAAVRAALAAKGLTPFPVCPTCRQQVPAATFSDLGVCAACTATLDALEQDALARHRATEQHQPLSNLTKSLLTAPLEVLGAVVVQSAGQTWDEEQADAILGARYGDVLPTSTWPTSMAPGSRHQRE